MANETITLKEADGPGTLTNVIVLGLGRQSEVDSKSLALSTEDKAVIDAIAASLAVMDDWDETDRMKVNLIAGQAGVSANTGAADAATQRVVLASNDAAVASLSVLDDWDETDRAKVNLIAGQAGITGGAGNVAANTPRVTLAGDDPLVLSVQGVAHGASASSVNPSLLGTYALAHGTNPTAVSAGQATKWYGNRAGVPWVIGGHPNVQSAEWVIAAADGAQTNAALLTVGSGAKIVVTQAQASMAGSNTTAVGIRLGLAAATLPSASPSTAAAGIILSGKFEKNCGTSRGTGAGIIAVGGDGDDLRVTCDSPTSGEIRITVSYYTIES